MLRRPLIFREPLTVRRDPDIKESLIAIFYKFFFWWAQMVRGALIFIGVTDDDFGCHWDP